jgi:hypothetical protein
MSREPAAWKGLHSVEERQVDRDVNLLFSDELLTQREAAALLRVGVSYLRASDCPKVLLPGRGAKGMPLVRYLRSDVLAWATAWRT